FQRPPREVGFALAVEFADGDERHPGQNLRMPRRFDRFLDELARTAVSARACNQYARGIPENAIRRRNLRLYLEQLDAVGPRLMLVREAVSYRRGRRASDRLVGACAHD